jgi:hypothetical protein
MRSVLPAPQVEEGPGAFDVVNCNGPAEYDCWSDERSYRADRWRTQKCGRELLAPPGIYRRLACARCYKSATFWAMLKFGCNWGSVKHLLADDKQFTME